MSWDGKERRKVAAVDYELLIRMDEKLDSALKKIEMYDKDLNGSNGTPGIKSDIRALKEHRETQGKHALAAWAGFFGMLGKVIGDFLTK